MDIPYGLHFYLPDSIRLVHSSRQYGTMMDNMRKYFKHFIYGYGSIIELNDDDVGEYVDNDGYALSRYWRSVGGYIQGSMSGYDQKTHAEKN